MGMDVFGTNPTEEKGAYFRNNVWWWHPLWDYCLNLHPDLCEKVENGHSNDGDGLDADDARELGERLLRDIAEGVTQAYEDEYRRHLSELPMRDCPYCQATGIRTDDVGREMGMDTEELPDDVAIILGRAFGTCNGCNGVGKSLSWEANYPFSVDNVRQFAEFALRSGGFSIC